MMRWHALHTRRCAGDSKLDAACALSTRIDEMFRKAARRVAAADNPENMVAKLRAEGERAAAPAARALIHSCQRRRSARMAPTSNELGL